MSSQVHNICLLKYLLGTVGTQFPFLAVTYSGAPIAKNPLTKRLTILQVLKIILSILPKIAVYTANSIFSLDSNTSTENTGTKPVCQNLLQTHTKQ